MPNVSVIPSNINLGAAEIELIGIPDKEFILSKEVEFIKEDYDYIIIDCASGRYKICDDADLSPLINYFMKS